MKVRHVPPFVPYCDDFCLFDVSHQRKSVGVEAALRPGTNNYLLTAAIKPASNSVNSQESFVAIHIRTSDGGQSVAATVIASGVRCQELDRLRSNFGALCVPVARANAVLGMLQFTRGHYLVFATTKLVAHIGPHPIFEVQDSKLVALWSSSGGSFAFGDVESKYVEIFQNADLDNTFYLSPTYDLTSTLQESFLSDGVKASPAVRRLSLSSTAENSDTGGNSASSFATVDAGTNALPFVLSRTLEAGRPKYDWGGWLRSGVSSLACLHALTAPMIHGAVVQRVLSDRKGIPGNESACHFILTLVARMSANYAGVRYRKRGVNADGHVANHVEVEQILFDPEGTANGGRLGRWCSITQIRGSVPLFWHHDPGVTRPKPPILYGLHDNTFSATKRHFAELLTDYGAPIVCISLLKRNEKSGREAMLAKKYREAIQSLQAEIWQGESEPAHFNAKRPMLPRPYRAPVIELHEFDFRAETNRAWNEMFSLSEISFDRTNMFEVDADGVVKSTQNGTVRSNCVDCVDRTNYAQFFVGLHAAAQQLYRFGVFSSPAELAAHEELVQTILAMWITVGDNIAVRYGGSMTVSVGLVHRGVVWDRQMGLRRFYNNNFKDKGTQTALDLLLGRYRPLVKQWEEGRVLLPMSKQQSAQSNSTPRGEGFFNGLLSRLGNTFSSSTPEPSNAATQLERFCEIWDINPHDEYALHLNEQHASIATASSTWWKDALQMFQRRLFENREDEAAVTASACTGRAWKSTEMTEGCFRSGLQQWQSFWLLSAQLDRCQLDNVQTMRSVETQNVYLGAEVTSTAMTGSPGRLQSFRSFEASGSSADVVFASVAVVQPPYECRATISQLHPFLLEAIQSFGVSPQGRPKPVLSAEDPCLCVTDPVRYVKEVVSSRVACDEAERRRCPIDSIEEDDEKVVDHVVQLLRAAPDTVVYAYRCTTHSEPCVALLSRVSVDTGLALPSGLVDALRVFWSTNRLSLDSPRSYMQVFFASVNKVLNERTPGAPTTATKSATSQRSNQNQKGSTSRATKVSEVPSGTTAPRTKTSAPNPVASVAASPHRQTAATISRQTILIADDKMEEQLINKFLRPRSGAERRVARRLHFLHSAVKKVVGEGSSNSLDRLPLARQIQCFPILAEEESLTLIRSTTQTMLKDPFQENSRFVAGYSRRKFLAPDAVVAELRRWLSLMICPSTGVPLRSSMRFCPNPDKNRVPPSSTYYNVFLGSDLLVWLEERYGELDIAFDSINGGSATFATCLAVAGMFHPVVPLLSGDGITNAEDRFKQSVDAGQLYTFLCFEPRVNVIPPLKSRAQFLTAEELVFVTFAPCRHIGQQRSDAAVGDTFVDTALEDVTTVDLSVLMLDEFMRMCFFVNLYNLLFYKVMTEKRLAPIDFSVAEQTRVFCIRDVVLSLADIKHGILRNNQPHPRLALPQFSESDTRNSLRIREPDPRVILLLADFMCFDEAAAMLGMGNASSSNTTATTNISSQLAHAAVHSNSASTLAVTERVALALAPNSPLSPANESKRQMKDVSNEGRPADKRGAAPNAGTAGDDTALPLDGGGNAGGEDDDKDGDAGAHVSVFKWFMGATRKTSEINYARCLQSDSAAQTLRDAATQWLAVVRDANNNSDDARDGRSKSKINDIRARCFVKAVTKFPEWGNRVSAVVSRLDQLSRL